MAQAEGVTRQRVLAGKWHREYRGLEANKEEMLNNDGGEVV
jgi:hypothetical protein